MMGDHDQCVTVAQHAIGRTVVLTVGGVLDVSSYLPLRDAIIKAALEEPDAVIINVSRLTVPTESALAVFTSASWLVGRWPEVPIILACKRRAGRDAIARNGVARYVPVYPSVQMALAALATSGPPPYRRRARANLVPTLASLRRSRDLVAEWLSAWSQTELIPVAKVIVTALVENVLQHTDGSLSVRLETDGATVTVAVEDTSHAPASVRESACGADAPSGLRIVSALCRTWGNSPTSSGKTVWAIIGPENRL